MDILLAVVILAAALAALAYPVYLRKTRVPLAPPGTLGDLLAQREGIYASLRDLELDYEMGKFDAADYTAHREKYLSRAAAVLQRLDALTGAEQNDPERSQDIERRVAEVRARRKADASRRGTGPRSSVAGYCPNCGRAFHSGDHFCRKCGHAL